MTHSDDTNPYKPPHTNESTETPIRSLNNRKDVVVSAIVVGVFFGVCTGFLGSYIAIPFIDSDPNLQWMFEATWFVSAIIGLLTGIHLGRSRYRAALETSKQQPQLEHDGDQP